MSKSKLIIVFDSDVASGDTLKPDISDYFSNLLYYDLKLVRRCVKNF